MRFVLADDMSDIADITHIDLSGISSLEGECTKVLSANLLHPSYADHSADESFAGDVSVLANCKSLSVFNASGTKISGKKFPALFFCWLCFRECSECVVGDIGVLANCKSLSVFGASDTGITGKFPAPFFCGPR